MKFSISGERTSMREIMNEALTKKLLDDFSRLFRDRNESPMQHGFEYGDGWCRLNSGHTPPSK